ncbi:MAG TPA: lysophospholipid acyltransferase family protein [Kiritimatiellia bacterium]|nr:lysophospholipid acyltransferase family protein [Kiritimatiellia bacterium]HOM59730.1 lysophospholipid acyltransferase family protein [Kiritimatiellia bacterium]HOR98896.1 lysophospholipid acyltransferase family protein [Kiritimatiellia bacterium]HPW76257.1 lysophospholipid acyltransferase family protein [Kiritimatiellia bacterium]
MAKKTRTLYRRMRRPLEWCAVWVALAVIPSLSLRRLLGLSRWIADIGLLFDYRGKTIARANLALMFGPRMTPYRERVIIRHAYRNMARVLVNVFWLSRDTRTRVLDQVAFVPSVLETLRAAHPAITVSAHFGNWEILSQACVAHGVPMMSVAKEIGSPEMTAQLIRLRSTIGQEIVPAEGAIRPLIQALRKGKSIGLLIDQHTHLWEGGAWISFFGVPAGISLTPAALALKLNRPVLFAWSRPLHDGRYRIEPGELFLPEPGLDAATLTQRIAAAFERVIRRHPSFWCLNYRRWRYIRSGDDPTRYPDYARPERIR